MKTMTKAMVGIAVAAVVGSGLFVCRAAAEETVARNKPHGMRARLAGLALTQDQKVQLRKTLSDRLATAKPLIQKFVAERRALRALVQAEKIDEAAIRAQVSKMSVTGADLVVEIARAAQELRPVLTADQLAKIDKFEQNADQRLDAVLNLLSNWLEQ